MLQDLTCFTPDRTTERKEVIQIRLRKYALIFELRSAEMPKLLQGRQIQDQVADGNTNTSLPIAWLKDTKRQVLDREVRVTRNVDERFKRHDEGRILGRFRKTPSRQVGAIR